MSKITGSEAVIKCLLEEQVDIIYGYPGGAIMPVYDELYKYQDKIHHVLTRHEQGATHSWHSLFIGLINYLTTSLDILLCPLIVTFKY